VTPETDTATASAPQRVAEAVEAAYAREWGRIVATLIRATGDWDLAEECAQDAFARAVERWPRDGVPQRPGAWLTTTARNRALDRLRRSATEAAKLRLLASSGPGPAEEPGPEAALAGYGLAGESPLGAGPLADDRLRLIFTCCHPALPMQARVALTLRTLAGLTTAEIARAFLVPERTMGQRIFRAKDKIRNAGIPYRVPPPHLLRERTAGVLAVLYLLFNEGYCASTGPDLLRPDLSGEALRLARTLVELMPRHPEALGLLALMLLHDARRAARTDADGALVTLERQDRSLWNREQIDEGLRLLDTALAKRRPGPYQIQAAIAACHAGAARAEDTDWPQIALLYRELARRAPGPVVELNRAVAVGMADGPERGLALLDALETSGGPGPAAGGGHLLPAARAGLLQRLGRTAEAAEQYRQALAAEPSGAERRHLEAELASLADSPRPAASGG